MDLAYDHIVEESLPKEDQPGATDRRPENQSTLNEDVKEAWSALATSSWGTWAGGFVGNAWKQGGSIVREAQQELSSARDDSYRSISDFVTRARSMTEGQVTLQASDRGKEADASSTDARPRESGESSGGAGAILDQIRGGVTKRWGDLRRAEDAADEALLKFGANVRDFFRDAVKIQDVSTESGVQRHFVSDGGKRVIHTSRYDAQLHVLHTTPDRFTKDPDGAEFGNWAKGFDAEKKTDDISKDLARYPELRATMESLVPATVPYADFWRRYYFFRHSVETAEARRRDLLKAASADEEFGWGDEDEEDDAATSKPAEKPVRPASTESSGTIHPQRGATPGKSQLKASEPRKSNDEKSQPDSDTSYDLVGAASGNPSQAPSSPKDSGKGDESDEDWE